MQTLKNGDMSATTIEMTMNGNFLSIYDRVIKQKNII